MVLKLIKEILINNNFRCQIIGKNTIRVNRIELKNCQYNFNIKDFKYTSEYDMCEYIMNIYKFLFKDEIDNFNKIIIRCLTIEKLIK